MLQTKTQPNHYKSLHSSSPSHVRKSLDLFSEDTDSNEELAEQNMYGGEDSDDERPEPLSEAQLAYFYAHYVDMDWD